MIFAVLVGGLTARKAVLSPTEIVSQFVDFEHFGIDHLNLRINISAQKWVRPM